VNCAAVLVVSTTVIIEADGSYVITNLPPCGYCRGNREHSAKQREQAAEER
jgi:hypothetical protein